MTWDAAIVLLRAPDGRVLGVTRGDDLRDINLPGGAREPEDASPVATARRELHEETGIRVRTLRPLAAWTQRGKRVVAFQGVTWSGRVRSSDEGMAGWVPPEHLTRASCKYQRENSKLLSWTLIS